MMHRQISVTASIRRIKPLPQTADQPLTTEQLAFFKSLLLREREALLQSAHETASHLQEFEPTPDPSDRASLEEDHALELRVRDRERRHLHAIDQALARIEDGGYGLCEESGEPIGFARLMARPTATLSLDEQTLRESSRNRRPLRGHA
jgi:DnaK suppressor protein